VKYFTRVAVAASTDVWEQAQAAYQRRLAEIVGRFSPGVRRLAYDLSLHDALVHRVVVNRKHQQLALELLCGDLQGGYFDLDLAYRGVALSPEVLTALAAASRDRRTEVLYDELDFTWPRGFAHRLLFWPDGETEILFADLEIATRVRGDRVLSLAGDPFVEHGEDDGSSP
jgi:hypothetical protein